MAAGYFLFHAKDFDCAILSPMLKGGLIMANIKKRTRAFTVHKAGQRLMLIIPKDLDVHEGDHYVLQYDHTGDQLTFTRTARSDPWFNDTYQRAINQTWHISAFKANTQPTQSHHR